MLKEMVFFIYNIDYFLSHMCAFSPNYFDLRLCWKKVLPLFQMEHVCEPFVNLASSKDLTHIFQNRDFNISFDG